MDLERRTAWWQGTEVLTGLSLAAMVFIGFMPLMVPPGIAPLGVPLMEITGPVLVPAFAAALIFVNAGRQHRLDRRHSSF